MEQFWLSIVGRESLISPDDVWGLLMVATVGTYLSIHLEQRYKWATRLSGAIVAMIIAMALGNLGILPSSSVLYDDVIQNMIVPMSMPILLMQCDLKKVWKETGRMLTIFLIGSVGTIVGAIVAYQLIKGPYGNAHDIAIASAALTGSYIGGGVNFITVAAQYMASEELTAADFVADSLMMAVSFMLMLACARSKWFRRHYSHPLIDAAEAGELDGGENRATSFWKRRQISLRDVAINIAYSVFVVSLSMMLSNIFANMNIGQLGFVLSQKYLWITTISVACATIFRKPMSRVCGSNEIGMYMLYLFIFVVGVPANIASVIKHGPLLMVHATIIILFNLAFCLIAAKLLRYNLEEAIIASNANIGATSTAVGMAISQGWIELIGPGLLAGILGYVLGNYGGMLVGALLGL